LSEFFDVVTQKEAIKKNFYLKKISLKWFQKKWIRLTQTVVYYTMI